VKIDDSLSGIADIRNIKQKKNKRSLSSSEASSVTAPGENVEFTETSSQLSMLEEALNTIETTDPGRLEALQQAIADGQFKVDEEVVADALIQNSIDQMKRLGKK